MQDRQKQAGKHAGKQTKGGQADGTAIPKSRTAWCSQLDVGGIRSRTGWGGRDREGQSEEREREVCGDQRQHKGRWDLKPRQSVDLVN